MNWIDEKLAKRRYAQKPIKPSMIIATSLDARRCAGLLEEYEKDMAAYRCVKAECDAKNLAIEQEVEDRIKEDSGLNTIPEQYRDKVWAYAWRQGHSYGYHEVQSRLIDLVEIFR